ncbi:DUF3017 domain-containing protein [Streptomyces sp. NPDC020875]|uniref:DUF3017 domain-containing protein n=1 Tax=Streptomyces sp. NPDC020875 TaxID=3154898 RepID=UPI003405409A
MAVTTNDDRGAGTGTTGASGAGGAGGAGDGGGSPGTPDDRDGARPAAARDADPADGSGSGTAGSRDADSGTGTGTDNDAATGTDADSASEHGSGPGDGADPANGDVSGAEQGADTGSDADSDAESGSGTGSTRRPPALTQDTARPEGGGRAAPGDAPAPARQWPLLAVLGLVGLGLVIVGTDPFAEAARVGTLLIGAALIGAGVLRRLIPSVGMLAVRSRFTDMVTYGLFGSMISLLALMLQPDPWLEIPFLEDFVHFLVGRE